MGQHRAVSIAGLRLCACMVILVATMVSGLGCSSGSSSIDDAGVGNDDSKAMLSVVPDSTCSGYLSELAIGTGYELTPGRTTIVGINSTCSEAPDEVDVTLQLGYDSDYETDDLAAPSGGWITLNGTEDDGYITSIQGVGKPKGAASSAYKSLPVCYLEWRACSASLSGPVRRNAHMLQCAP